MTPFYLTHNSLIEDEHDQTQLSAFTIATDHTSSFPFPFLFNIQQDKASDGDRNKPIDLLLTGEPTDRQVSFPTYNNNTNIIMNPSLCDPYVKDEDPQGSGKWMSSKMRIMRKMMNSDHQIAASRPTGTNNQVLENQRQQNQDSSSSSSSNTNHLGAGVIRVCSDCHTTKTPLWRSGPRGPKSLCNACGIRQRKARRAAMTAAAVNAGLVPSSENPNKAQMAKRTDQVDRTIPFKKRCRMITASSGAPNTKLRFESFDDVSIRLGKGSANCQRVFPQDERDAAILLMALSSGLIRS